MNVVLFSNLIWLHDGCLDSCPRAPTPDAEHRWRTGAWTTGGRDGKAVERIERSSTDGRWVVTTVMRTTT